MFPSLRRLIASLCSALNSAFAPGSEILTPVLSSSLLIEVGTVSLRRGNALSKAARLLCASVLNGVAVPPDVPLSNFFLPSGVIAA